MIDGVGVGAAKPGVLRAAMRHDTAAAIAAALHLSEGTVRNYLSAAIQKLRRPQPQRGERARGRERMTVSPLRMVTIHTSSHFATEWL